MKIDFKKADWIKLLKQNMITCPFHKDETESEYTAAENVIITINTKTTRHYTFGGPVWIGILDVADDEFLNLSYLSPLKKPRRIKWNNIKSIEFIHFCSGHIANVKKNCNKS
jgi:hypothetical protein